MEYREQDFHHRLMRGIRIPIDTLIAREEWNIEMDRKEGMYSRSE
jgi:hypothetical protein